MSVVKKTKKTFLVRMLYIGHSITYLYFVICAFLPQLASYGLALMIPTVSFISFYRYRTFYKEVVSPVFSIALVVWLILAIWRFWLSEELSAFWLFLVLFPAWINSLSCIAKRQKSLADEQVRVKM